MAFGGSARSRAPSALTSSIRPREAGVAMQRSSSSIAALAGALAKAQAELVNPGKVAYRNN